MSNVGWPLVCVYSEELLAQPWCGCGLVCFLSEAVSSEGRGCDGLWVVFRSPNSLPKPNLHNLPMPSLRRAVS